MIKIPSTPLCERILASVSSISLVAMAADAVDAIVGTMNCSFECLKCPNAKSFVVWGWKKEMPPNRRNRRMLSFVVGVSKNHEIVFLHSIGSVLKCISSELFFLIQECLVMKMIQEHWRFTTYVPSNEPTREPKGLVKFINHRNLPLENWCMSKISSVVSN